MTERELEHRRRQGLGLWVIASLVLHLVLLAGLFLIPFDRVFPNWTRGKDLPREEPIEFTILDTPGLPGAPLEKVVPKPEDLRAAEENKETKPEEEKKPEDDPQPKGQVVELAPPKVEERPDKAKYVSEYNMRVDKETRARNNGKPEIKAEGSDPTVRPNNRPEVQGTQVPQPKGPVAPPGSQTSKQADNGTGGEPIKQPKKTAGNPGAEQRSPLLAMRTEPRRGSRSEAEVGIKPGGEMEAKGEAAKREKGEARAGGAPPAPMPGTSGRPAPPGVPGSVLPSFSMSSRASGGGSNDYLKDVEDGDSTGLNAKSWRYASFFNRVKRAVAQNWHPDVVYRRYDPNGQVFGTRDRLTMVRVQLKRDGSLKSVALEKPSGVEFLDDEAIQALKQSEPFVNPPAGLVDKNSGLISFRFGFYFEIGSSSRVKLFRY